MMSLQGLSAAILLAPSLRHRPVSAPDPKSLSMRSTFSSSTGSLPISESFQLTGSHIHSAEGNQIPPPTTTTTAQERTTNKLSGHELSTSQFTDPLPVVRNQISLRYFLNPHFHTINKNFRIF